jgi:serine protease Do
MTATTVKKNLYEILEVSVGASGAEIKAAYDAKVDRAGAPSSEYARAARIALNEAHSVLSNEQRRAAYDARLHRSPPDPVAASSAVDGPSSNRTRLVVVALVVLAVGAWFVMRHRAAPAKPIVVAAPRLAHVSAPTVVELREIAPALPRSDAAEELSAEQLYSTVSPSVVRINASKRDGSSAVLGSGVILGPDSVITNCHVALAGDQIEVRERDVVLSAVVSVADEVFDLCKLRVNGLTARAATPSAAPPLKVGQRVYAIGSPQGLDLTLSEGIVSALREGPSGTYIQTTAPVSPGSSGGGLFDHQGRLVGIVTFQMRAGQNLNFAIPVEWIDKMSTRRREAERETTPNASIRPAADTGRDVTWLGAWHCFGPLTGRGLDLVFDSSGTFTGKIEGKPARGHYTLSRTTLMLTDSQQSMSFAIEELTPQRMVINRGQGQRLVCDR